MASRHNEPTVRFASPMPRGYTFVPKGNVYITSHCRKQTQEAGETVYTVLNPKNAAVGIRVPRRVHTAVLESHKATQEKRAQAVQRKDQKLEREFRDAVLSQFPGTPSESVAKIVSRAMLKRSRRVGRTGMLDVAERAALAVRAHIRHVHTRYDQLLRDGVSREQARSQTYEKIDEVMRSWGGRTRRRGLLSNRGNKGQESETSKGTSSSRRGEAVCGTGRKLKRGTSAPFTKPRREKKLVIRQRSSASAASKDERPEPCIPSTKSVRRKFGASLLDDANSESEEFEWSGSEFSSGQDSEYDDNE